MKSIESSIESQMDKLYPTNLTFFNGLNSGPFNFLRGKPAPVMKDLCNAVTVDPYFDNLCPGQQKTCAWEERISPMQKLGLA